MGWVLTKLWSPWSFGHTAKCIKSELKKVNLQHWPLSVRDLNHTPQYLKYPIPYQYSDTGWMYPRSTTVSVSPPVLPLYLYACVSFRIGRVKILMFTSFCQFGLGVAVAFSGNYYVFVVLRFLLAMVSSVCRTNVCALPTFCTHCSCL